jgi:DNA-binding transcriptional regulator of glucitol operon
MLNGGGEKFISQDKRSVSQGRHGKRIQVYAVAHHVFDNQNSVRQNNDHQKSTLQESNQNSY